MWFDAVPVWGFEANGAKWRHPSTDRGRDNVPVPPPEGRDPMWDSLVESRVSREAPAVGSKHPCHLVGVPNRGVPVQSAVHVHLDLSERGSAVHVLDLSQRLFLQCSAMPSKKLAMLNAKAGAATGSAPSGRKWTKVPLSAAWYRTSTMQLLGESLDSSEMWKIILGNG